MRLGVEQQAGRTPRTDLMSEIAVDVFWIDTDAAASEVERLHPMLSGDERHRAARYHLERDRRRYIVRHGTLRERLSVRLDCPPWEIRFCINGYGKPSVADTDLRFNLSHSHGIALYVVARGLEVGCDIEWRNPDLACEPVAERFFSTLERRELQSLDPAQRIEGFFNCWTRKEAYVKALGCGLSLSLGSFDVSLAPSRPAALLNGCAGWSLKSLEPVPGYQAAVVAEGADWRLVLGSALTPIAR